MDLGLSSRVALVVGGTGYIGSAIADRLREEGATVVVGSRKGGDLTVDASDDASVDAAVAKVRNEHGRLDVLVVAAAPAAGSMDPATTSEPDVVLGAVDGKAMSFLRLARAVLPGMRDAGFGRVVAISGQNAYLTGNIAGTIRNAALDIAAKSLADDYAGSGATVNVVNPGGVVDDPSATAESGKPGPSSPAQIGALVAFLASDIAATISGESVAIGHRVRGIASF